MQPGSTVVVTLPHTATTTNTTTTTGKTTVASQTTTDKALTLTSTSVTLKTATVASPTYSYTVIESGIFLTPGVVASEVCHLYDAPTNQTILNVPVSKLAILR